MGKGTITGGGTDGRYTISVDYGTDIRDDLLAIKSARKAALEPQIETLQETVNILSANETASQAELSVAIEAYNASEKTEEDKAALAVKTEAPLADARMLRQARSDLSMMQMELAAIDTDITELNGLTLTETKTAWCADYTEDGSGDVATIEINAERPTCVIAPQCPEHSATYGRMIARELQEGYQVYYNGGILPGVQKWRPTFRSGIIQDINYAGDTCTVNLDDAASSAQGLPINQSSTLSDVPIEYMTCNSAAFENGDKVVVQFVGQSWSSPKVIGFVTNPRPCGVDELWFLVEIAERNATTDGFSIGEKFRGVPITTTNSYPVPGLWVHGGSVGSDYANKTADIEPPNYDPPNVEYNVDTLRVRFDQPWKKEFGTDLYFERTSSIDAEVTSHPEYVDMPPDLSSLEFGGGLVVQAFTTATLQLERRWGDPTAGTAPWVWTNIIGESIVITDPEEPIWYGTMPNNENYGMQGWSGVGWDSGYPYTANDLDHASEWMLQFYTPPETIQVIIEEVEYYYHFVRIGGAPKSSNVLAYVYPVTPPSFWHEDTYTTKGEHELAVVYRRGDVVT